MRIFPDLHEKEREVSSKTRYLTNVSVYRENVQVLASAVRQPEVVIWMENPNCTPVEPVAFPDLLNLERQRFLSLFKQKARWDKSLISFCF